MELILSSIFPIFILILIGVLFKKISFPSHDFWPMADKLTYYVLMPALLINSLSKAKLELLYFNSILSLLIAIFLTALLLVIFNKLSSTRNSSFTSVMQGGTRFNTYIFLALSSSLFGEKGILIASIIITFAIPFLNILNISIFAIYKENSKLDFIYLVKSILQNPLIIACFIGTFINFFGISIPISFEKSLQVLGSAALPLGLLSIGYALVLGDLKSTKKDIFISSFAKFLVLPIFTYILAVLFNLDEDLTAILVLFSIMPTATSAFILARQLGGDTKLMSAIITVQTLVSAPILVIFLAIFFK